MNTPVIKRKQLTVLGGLFAFGCAYNYAFNRSRPRLTEPYTAEWVIIGTAVTLGGAALAEPFTPGWVLACFAASGLPMALWDAERFAQKWGRLTMYKRGRRL
jgi:hypothetical protein